MPAPAPHVFLVAFRWSLAGHRTALAGPVAALSALALLAGGFPSAAPAADSTGETFRSVVLDNGLHVLLARSSAHPVVSVSCFVGTGGRTEDEYYQGSLHYIEHLVFKGGTPNLAPTEFRKKMSLLGRESGGWTWDDEINFGFEVPKENFAEAISTFREALLDLDFEEDWFEAEKLVVLQEMTRGLEQPDRMIYKAWDELAFVEHPYGRTVIGTEKAIRELDMTKTLQYYRDRFSPNHIILSVAGDFDEWEMLASIREVWGALEKGPESFELGLSEPPQHGPRRRTEFVPQATTGLLLTGFVTPGGEHEDTPALEMLAALLNDSSYGLPQFLEEQEKWVTTVSASHYPMRDYGTFQLFARADPGKLAAVERFASSFLLQFDVTKIPESVFEETRQRLLFDEAQERDSAAARAARFGFLVSRRGLDGARQLVSRWESLTAADVAAAKERWFGPRRTVTVTVYPEDFDPDAVEYRRVDPAAPFANAPPNLDVPGALQPPDGALPVSFRKISEEDGATLFQYANGLRLVVRPSAASDLLAVSGRVLGGQWVEPAGREGVNRFVSELGLRRTRRWSREEFARLLGSLSIEAGAHANVGSRANTSRNVDYRDSAAHHLLGLDSTWPQMLAILKETIFFPEIEKREVDKLREDLLTEIRALDENNLELIKQEFYVRAYGDHPYGRPTIGTEKSLEDLNAGRVAAFHATNWTPDRVVVSVVGDCDPDEVAKWIASRWADVESRAADPWSLDPTRWDLSWNPPTDTQVLELGKDYWTVNWGRPGCTYREDCYFPSVVLSRMAGNDHFYKYVYGEGVSYRSWIRFWEQLGPGAWILENDVQRERFDEILGMFDEDLARYSTVGFSTKEFDEAVQRLVNSTILDAQDNALLAWQFAVAVGNGTGLERVTDRVEKLRAVRFEDVQALASSVFAPETVLRLIQQ